MVLYIDETEDEERFYVAGLLVESPEKVDSSFRRFKKSIQNFRLSAKARSIVFTEFKATLLDRKYQRIKIKMLEEMAVSAEYVFYSVYEKQGKFMQTEKEQTYINMLTNIAKATSQNIDIIFDSFNKPDFETSIITALMEQKNVVSIRAADSQVESGLKYADNICSSIRLHESNEDKNGFYSVIEKIAIRA